MEELLKSGLINLTELAIRLYPNKTRPQASNTLRAKVFKNSFNKLSDKEKHDISNVVFGFASELKSHES